MLRLLMIQLEILLLLLQPLMKLLKEKLQFGGNKEAAKEVGKLIAEKAIDKGIKQVVFDRGGYIYHGRVKELAEAAREAGLGILREGGRIIATNRC